METKEFKVGTKVTIVKLRHPENYPDNFIGSQGVIKETKVSFCEKFNVRIEIPGVKVQSSYDWYSEDEFEVLEEAKMTNLSCKDNNFKPGDTVKVSGCTDGMAKYNGMTGVYLGRESYRYARSYMVCFDGSGVGCGYLFADSELEVIPQAPQFAVGDNVTVMLGSNALEFADGALKLSNSVKYEAGKSSDIAIYEVTGEFKDDTIIRRISDGRVFFVQQRFIKAYIAAPKFKRGDWVIYGDEYYKVVLSKIKGNKVEYEITQFPQSFAENKEFNAKVVAEDNLKEAK